MSSPLASQRDADHLRQVLRVHEYCGLVDTTDLGGSFLSSFSKDRRTPKGRERKGLARLRGEEDMLFTGMDKDSRSSSSTQVTLQPLEWGLDSKLVTEN